MFSDEEEPYYTAVGEWFGPIFNKIVTNSIVLYCCFYEPLYVDKDYLENEVKIIEWGGVRLL